MAFANPGTTGTSCDESPHGCEIKDLFRLLGKAHVLDILHLFIQDETAPPHRLQPGVGSSGPPGAATGPYRFVEIQRRLGLSPNTLSERLKDLVQAGLLTKTMFNEIPPRVDYEATPKALDLRSVFEALGAWASRHDLEPLASERGASRAAEQGA